MSTRVLFFVFSHVVNSINEGKERECIQGRKRSSKEMKRHVLFKKEEKSVIKFCKEVSGNLSRSQLTETQEWSSTCLAEIL